VLRLKVPSWSLAQMATRTLVDTTGLVLTGADQVRRALADHETHITPLVIDIKAVRYSFNFKCTGL